MDEPRNSSKTVAEALRTYAVAYARKSSFEGFDHAVNQQMQVLTDSLKILAVMP